MSNSGGSPWLDSFEVKPGDWMTVVKSSSFEKFMSPGYCLKTNVAASLILHTQGYARKAQYDAKFRSPERAITLKNGEPVFLRASHIAEEIHRVHKRCYRQDGITDNLEKVKPQRQHIRRALAELEDDGSLLRRRESDGKPVRDLTAEEARKLGPNVIYDFFVLPRKPKAGTMRRIYEEKVAERESEKVASNRLPFAASIIRDIRLVSTLFPLDNSPFFRLSAETPAENLAIIQHGIESARLTFIETVAKEKPEAFEEGLPETAVQSSPDIRSEIPASLTQEKEVRPIASGASDSVVSRNGAVPQGRPIESEAMPPKPELRPSPNGVPATGPSVEAATLRAGLVSRGFSTLDRTAIDRLAAELAEAPLERFWITLEDRMRRGRALGLPVLAAVARTALENYRASQVLMESKVSAKSERDLSPQAEAVHKFLLERLKDANVA